MSKQTKKNGRLGSLPPVSPLTFSDPSGEAGQKVGPEWKAGLEFRRLSPWTVAAATAALELILSLNLLSVDFFYLSLLMR